MYTLGLETSCDETSCAVLKNTQVLSNVTISSLNQHKKYGGVVPEVATRAHLKNIDKVLQAALTEAKVPLKKIDLIAVTRQPGLIGALVVGLNFAKTLALALNKPFIGVNHLHAHLFAPFLQPVSGTKGAGHCIGKKYLSLFPFLGVVVSGGHTDFYLVKDFDQLRLIGQMQDDACGETYDKVARALNLGYPGGPVIDKMFNINCAHAFKFKCGRKNFDLSFSGIKTAVMYKKQMLEKENSFNKKACVALVSSFQYAVVEEIIATVLSAASKYRVKTVVCGGGVAANRYLRRRLLARAQNFNCIIPEMRYTSDNAAMVAGLGFYLYNKGFRHNLKLGVVPS